MNDPVPQPATPSGWSPSGVAGASLGAAIISAAVLDILARFHVVLNANEIWLIGAGSSTLAAYLHIDGRLPKS